MANPIKLSWVRVGETEAVLTVNIPGVAFRIDFQNIGQLREYMNHGIDHFLRQ